jgi:LysM repeat protein
MYHTTVAEIVRLNGLKNPNVLLIGQKLRVPCPGLPDDGNKPPDDGGQPDGGACQWYVVQRGDNLSKIAAHYGTSVAAIVQANHLKNANLIFVGQKLCIPDP